MITAQDVKAKAREFGADAVSIGSIDRWEGAPIQKNPRQFMLGARLGSAGDLALTSSVFPIFTGRNQVMPGYYHRYFQTISSAMSACGVRIMLLGLAVAVSSATAEESQALSRQHIGDRLVASNVRLADDNSVIFHTLANIRFGHGQGEDFTRWRIDSRTQQLTRHSLPFPNNHQPAMITSHDFSDGSMLYFYVSRSGREHAYLQHVSPNGDLRTLFDLQGGGRLLNPVLDVVSGDVAHLLIPNRGGRNTRRFLVDMSTASHQQLPDIEMPRRGARIYQRVLHGSQLFVPLTVDREILMMVINLETHDVTIKSLDDSAPREQPRVTRIFMMEESQELVLVYMRPAPFSNRGRTGLLGEIVCAVVCARSLEVKTSTVIAGFEAERAATHQHDMIQVGSREFIYAHTEVDRVHERHKSGRYENYVGSYITRWQIDENNKPIEVGRRKLPDTAFFDLAGNAQGNVILLANDAKEDYPLFLYAFHKDDI